MGGRVRNGPAPQPRRLRRTGRARDPVRVAADPLQPGPRDVGRAGSRRGLAAGGQRLLPLDAGDVRAVRRAVAVPRAGRRHRARPDRRPAILRPGHRQRLQRARRHPPPVAAGQTDPAPARGGGGVGAAAPRTGGGRLARRRGLQLRPEPGERHDPHAGAAGHGDVAGHHLAAGRLPRRLGRSRLPPARHPPPGTGRTAAGPCEPEHGGPADLTFVPYCAWANRGTGPMTVWAPMHR
ncbi:hypothetical protein [Nonomuraea helvata]|uniref:hypothetical protein n=1 Tax=Nonomuraea helvata TaxID=37484 RepID=UPI003CD0A7FC